MSDSNLSDDDFELFVIAARNMNENRNVDDDPNGIHLAEEQEQHDDNVMWASSRYVKKN